MGIASCLVQLTEEVVKIMVVRVVTVWVSLYYGLFDLFLTGYIVK